MTTSPVFARAQPRAVTIEETYYYEGEISRNTYLDLARDEEGNVREPAGRIVVEAPYDGFRWLNQQAQADIEQGIAKGLDEHEAVIGYLAFGNMVHTDLPSRLGVDLLSTAWPILLPLQDRAGQGLRKLIQQDAVCHIREDYRIDSAANDTIPIQVSVGLNEEPDLLDALTGSTQGGSRSKSYQTFQRDLALGLNLQVIIPKAYTCERVLLEQGSVSWPHMTLPHLLNLQPPKGAPNASSLSLQVKPTTGELIWQNIPLKRSSSEGSQSEYSVFETRKFALRTERPTDLYEVSSLDARFDLLLDQVLLSGLQVRAFASTGKPVAWQRFSLNDPALFDEPILRIGTRLHVGVRIWLEDVFRQKTYTPRRHLEFEGVVPSKERIEDIKGLLQDMGFERIEVQIDGGDAIRRARLKAIRPEHARQMEIHIDIRGELGHATTRRIIAGGLSHQTDQTIGRTSLDIIVRRAADHQVLTETLNNLQVSLNERFLHVSGVR